MTFTAYDALPDSPDEITADQGLEPETGTPTTPKLAGDEQLCEYCEGTGIDTNRAVVPLVPGMADYVRAMYPCIECDGEGKVESTDPAYVATMRIDS